MKQYQKYFTLLTLLVASCVQKHGDPGPHYSVSPDDSTISVFSFAVHPLHNPNKLMQAYQPLIDYLNPKVEGVRFTLEASRDYASYEQKYKARKPEFLLPNPWQTLQAMKAGYHVIAMAGEPCDFKGIFIVRKDNPIRTPHDLKGKTVSYPASTALAACIMPQYFLHLSGINVSTDIENRYVGSQESSIMNVYLGLTAVGATWPPPWRNFQKNHPREAALLKVIWETEPLINNSVMMRNDIPAEIGEQVRKLLTELHETDQGKAILAGMETARFFIVSDKDYDVVRAYVDRFEKEVRKIELK
ncbi:MAG: phosphate/phosphite/phosphonate ABC transporter substrate-binding protein [Bacteroidales bacterium]|nr:phosphate/phosphite/phosphonate ABC transporter substrate-binding protein [Bacteroidales bacterium]